MREMIDIQNIILKCLDKVQNWWNNKDWDEAVWRPLVKKPVAQWRTPKGILYYIVFILSRSLAQIFTFIPFVIIAGFPWRLNTFFRITHIQDIFHGIKYVCITIINSQKIWKHSGFCDVIMVCLFKLLKYLFFIQLYSTF